MLSAQCFDDVIAMSHNWANVLIRRDNTIREALQAINSEILRIALVVDSDQRLTGIVTDGDVRRGLLKGHSLCDKVENIINSDFVSARVDTSRDELIHLMKENDVLSVPLLEDGVVVGLETLHRALEKPLIENPVFILAGGFGRRLHPLTDSCPKPMLRVGDRPILETVLRSFIDAGFMNFYFATHFMPDKIKSHFGNGEKWGVTINYICEESPLGTGGALGLLSDNPPDKPMVVMNGDILTKVDFNRLLEFHEDNGADATMCVREHNYQVPFGVVDGSDGRIVRMVEKPTYQHFINAGIYVVNGEIVRGVPKNKRIDMPTLLELEIEKQRRVLMFPIHEYWLDVGRMNDFNKAQTDIRALGLG